MHEDLSNNPSSHLHPCPRESLISPVNPSCFRGVGVNHVDGGAQAHDHKVLLGGHQARCRAKNVWHASLHLDLSQLLRRVHACGTIRSLGGLHVAPDLHVDYVEALVWGYLCPQCGYLCPSWGHQWGIVGHLWGTCAPAGTIGVAPL